MKIFISWSGTQSQKAAEILKQWIPCVIQSVEPYFSSADIDKGARWSTDIAKELQDASYGILCVTKENLSSAWLNFEAGALSKSIEQSKVCPFLVDLKPSDIQDSPILQFQMANASKDDVFKLFKSINTNLGDMKLNEGVLSTTFETFWPKIEEALKEIPTATNITTPTKKNVKDAQLPIEEILDLVRYQHKLLKSPENLLPAEYLIEVFRMANKNFPKDFIIEIDEQLHMIEMLASDALDKCAVKYKDGQDVSITIGNMPMCAGQLKEIQERVQRLSTMVRRRYRNSSFIL